MVTGNGVSLVRFVHLVLLAVPLALAGPVAAEPMAEADSVRLDQLFVELKTARGIEEGRAVEAQIVSIWLKSGNAEIDTG